MKRIILILSLVFVSWSTMFGVNPEVKKANDLYAKANYTAAIDAYEQIIQTEGIAPELYYNLGNAYYKSGEVAKSILNYERALRLNPNYTLAKNNLEMAQLKVVDNVVQIPAFFLKRWVDLLVKLLSSNQWLMISVIIFILALVFGLLFVFGYNVAYRKLSFYFAVVLFVFTVFTGGFSAIRKSQMESHSEAVVMSSSVIVKSSPDKNGTDLFSLHDGTKVTIKSKLGNWTEIILGNGNVGWVEANHIEKI